MDVAQHVAEGNAHDVQGRFQPRQVEDLDLGIDEICAWRIVCTRSCGGRHGILCILDLRMRNDVGWYWHHHSHDYYNNSKQHV
jgi:hypothetical protein